MFGCSSVGDGSDCMSSSRNTKPTWLRLYAAFLRKGTQKRFCDSSSNCLLLKSFGEALSIRCVFLMPRRSADTNATTVPRVLAAVRTTTILHCPVLRKCERSRQQRFGCLSVSSLPSLMLKPYDTYIHIFISICCAFVAGARSAPTYSTIGPLAQASCRSSSTDAI